MGILFHKQLIAEGILKYIRKRHFCVLILFKNDVLNLVKKKFCQLFLLTKTFLIDALMLLRTLALPPCFNALYYHRC